MRVMITKASSDDWVDFKEFDTIQDVFSFYEKTKHGLIIGRNFFYGDLPQEILLTWDRISYKTAVLISDTKYKITIHDDYIY